MTKATNDLPSEELVQKIIDICESKKAVDTIVFDVRGESVLADFYLFCGGNSGVQLKAIADALHKDLKDEFSLLPRAVEGNFESKWILVDYQDVLVHIFENEVRAFYNIEEIHADTPVFYRAEA